MIIYKFLSLAVVVMFVVMWIMCPISSDWEL